MEIKSRLDLTEICGDVDNFYQRFELSSDRVKFHIPAAVNIKRSSKSLILFR